MTFFGLVLLRNNTTIAYSCFPFENEITLFVFFQGPPDAPLITNITVDGKRCSLQWARPYNGESPIEIYTVTVWLYRASNGSDFKETPNSWNTTQTYSLVDLPQWNQNYTTAVSAWNKYGQSFYGREIRFTTGKFQG